ncbi:hypothetical protein [Salipiger marinus]|uniref:Uncharacterized protein n=1 Tax=Salipiger marinus TaxID=555512 RepID=A0A1G8RY75_9RHOB|nr:hypothetical protein [Salipiger marinus]SDJ21903.1 hypothetical protein SAMN04487993_102237 [Salipiger marinus]
MLVHAQQCAFWHINLQEPNDTLPNVPLGPLSSLMADDFRSAFLWHIEKHKTTTAQLTAGTGVSRDVINKLKARDGASTTVENGMLIAAYYGKTVNEFVNLEESTSSSRLSALFSLLRPEEQRLLEAQIRGLIASHDA